MGMNLGCFWADFGLNSGLGHINRVVVGCFICPAAKNVVQIALVYLQKCLLGHINWAAVGCFICPAMESYASTHVFEKNACRFLIYLKIAGCPWFLNKSK